MLQHILLALTLGSAANADLVQMDRSLAALEGQFTRAGGSTKAFNQLRCFLKSHGSAKFIPKPTSPEMSFRCNIRQEIQLTNPDKVALIDYTKTSNLVRFFIFDLKNRKMETMRIAHGRFGDTDRMNDRVMYNPKKNSVLKVVHFSNQVGSNASAGGFYLSGQQYFGQWGNSLVLHGLEGGVNDNSCERATVIHRSASVTATKVNAMSSGCPMVPVNKIDQVVKDLYEGTVVYVYTPGEAALSEKTCGRSLSKVKN